MALRAFNNRRHAGLVACRAVRWPVCHLEPSGGASAMNQRRVAITAAGLMSTLGTTRGAVWSSSIHGRCGIGSAKTWKIFNHFPSTPSDVVASCFGFEGLKASVLSACSSGTVAIGYAADAIGWDQIDIALAGASDVLCRLTFSGFNALRLVDTEPCRPFCRTRKGMNIGEAAALLVLEELSHAKRRGAKIYAEIAGYGVR